MSKRGISRLILLSALIAIASALSAASAFGAVSWRLSPVSNTTAAPGGSLTYDVQVINVGDTATSTEATLTATLPPGLTPVTAEGFSCASAAQTVACAVPAGYPSHENVRLRILADVDPSASGILTARFGISGADAAVHTADPVRISSQDPGFGIDAFDGLVSGPSGSAYTQAAGHPALQSTFFDFNLHTDPIIGPHVPVEDGKDVEVDLPPGLVGGTVGLGECTALQISNGTGVTNPLPECPISSQLGVLRVRTDGGEIGYRGVFPIFNMAPPPGVPARFGVNVLGSIVVLDAKVLGAGADTHLRVGSESIPQGLTIAGNSLEFWGVPSDPSHDSLRACEGQSFPENTCAPATPPRAFLRNPTTCTAPGQALEARIQADSWQHPGALVSDSYRFHEAPGYPEPEEEGPAGGMHRVWGPEVGIDACDAVPFEPTLAASLTTNRADAPTGLAVDIGLPSSCWEPRATAAEVEASICQSDMKSARVRLPQGLTLNPSAAGAIEACSPAQVGVTSPLGAAAVSFDEAAVSCPNAAKIGSVEITTPLLEDPLDGSVYLAQQSQNPFKSLLAMYLVAEGSGVRIKQAAEVSLDPNTGRVTTTFADVPQQPFSKIHVELYGGSRAALRTPASCGAYTAAAELSAWSDVDPQSGKVAPADVVHRDSSFQISEGCGGGFDPKLSAGTQNPLAGSYSPFHLRLSREDTTQELAGLSLKLPRGLLANLSGLPYCSDAILNAISPALGTGAAQAANPSCPAGSQIGTVTVGAGPGPNPYYTSLGRLYWSGPYKGAPVSIAAVVPAVAGPFDLGTVVVRNALHVNPESVEITAASDPLPSILAGIPLDLRDVRIDIDRPNYTFNPTSCEAQSVAATLTSTMGASAERANNFQAAACDRLAFKPKLSLRLRGGTKRSKHPALTAILRARRGDANIGRVSVALPHSEFLAQNHIRTICTRVRFAADACPKGSIYGKVSATSPILGYRLSGNVYLRSSSNPLPDMVLKLKGPASQPIEVNAVGRIDSKNGGIRTTFASVPDAPLTKVVIKFPGGRKSLLENSRNLCRSENSASVKMDAQSGRIHDFAAPLKVSCPKHKGAKKKQRHGGR